MRLFVNPSSVLFSMFIPLIRLCIQEFFTSVSDNGLLPVEQSDDGWLNFTKITRAESGWYKCYTRHMLGIFTSIGYFLNVRCE